MILDRSHLEDLREHINGMPNFLFSLKGCNKKTILANKDTMEQLWCLYQKSVQEYDCDADWSARDALRDVLGISHDDELRFVDYALHIQGGVRGDYYNSFANLEELREEVSRHFTAREIQSGLVDRLTTFRRSKVNDDGYIENKYQNISVCAYLG